MKLIELLVITWIFNFISAQQISIETKISLSASQEFQELHCILKSGPLALQVFGFYLIPGSNAPELGTFNGQFAPPTTSLSIQYFAATAGGTSFRQTWSPNAGVCKYNYDSNFKGFSYECTSAGSGATPFVTTTGSETFCDPVTNPKCVVPLPFPPDMCLQPTILPPSTGVPTFTNVVYSSADGSNQVAFHLTGVGATQTGGVLTGGYFFTDGKYSEQGYYSVNGINVIFPAPGLSNTLVSTLTATSGPNKGNVYPVIDIIRGNFVEDIYCEVPVDKVSGLYNFTSFTKHCFRSILPAVSSPTIYKKLLSYIPKTVFNDVNDILAIQAPICQYGGYCKADNDCYAGNFCKKSNEYYSQCQPNIASYKKSNCLSNFGNVQCTKDSECCDPGAYCNGNKFRQCQQPAIGSDLCSNPKKF